VRINKFIKESKETAEETNKNLVLKILAKNKKIESY
jgi:hypothetical protein